MRLPTMAYAEGLFHEPASQTAKDPPGGGHKELVISMLDEDDVWALACGFIASQLSQDCPFNSGETINFHEKISPRSKMSSFVSVHPLELSSDDQMIDLGERRVELMQLIPLYDAEREWLGSGGDLNSFLDAYSPFDLMDPKRPEFGRAN